MATRQFLVRFSLHLQARRLLVFWTFHLDLWLWLAAPFLCMQRDRERDFESCLRDFRGVESYQFGRPPDVRNLNSGDSFSIYENYDMGLQGRYLLHIQEME